MPSLTEHQREAVEAGGNVLVVAGAGAGKTSTLAGRCIQRILDPRNQTSIEDILMVTFTEAAAAEMRHRIRRDLEAADGDWAAAQFALLDLAQIGTLHAFCLSVVRENFLELKMDPSVTVLGEVQARALADNALDELLEEHYTGERPGDLAVQQLISTTGGGREDYVRRLILRIHEYTQTLPDPAGWIAREMAAFDAAQPPRWTDWMMKGIAAWRIEWMEALSVLRGGNPKAAACHEVLNALGEVFDRGQAAAALLQLTGIDADWPRGTKTKLRPALERLFEEAAFLKTIAVQPEGRPDPLQEDWDWVRGPMKCLLELTEEFGRRFAALKRASAAVDFHDLEQGCLRLFWDPERNRPTPLAERWRRKWKHVLVDEYQDINAAQDRILCAISGEGAEGNRFLVGDVKQSIYRFRLANPRIFLSVMCAWKGGNSGGRVVRLSENFRSHEAILEFVNRVFLSLMRPEVGGLGYPEEEQLRLGAREQRPAMTRAADPEPRVEMHLRFPGGGGVEAADSAGPGTDAAMAGRMEMEARIALARLRELMDSGLPIQSKEGVRPVRWGDMAVLLRSARNSSEAFAKEFQRQGIPLEVDRGGFFEAAEVIDLVSLVQLLDNPLQDIPALAVLRSPLAGLTLDELALVRLHRRKGRYWNAVRAFHQDHRPATTPDRGERPALQESAWAKIDAFLQAFPRWRQLARVEPLSNCLETILDETRYEQWLVAQPRGNLRRANVRRLLQLTRQFDEYQRSGIFRFLQFVAAQEEGGESPAAAEGGDAVRLMSIHKSKGLEFPIVVLAGTGTLFNFEELTRPILLDEVYGLACLVRPPFSERRYMSLPYWLAARNQRRERLGEEMRLLYVAATRACERLILTGTAARSAPTNRWHTEPAHQLSVSRITSAGCFLDWLGPLMPGLTGSADWAAAGEGRSALLRWRIWKDEDIPGPPAAVPGNPQLGAPLSLTSAVLDRLSGTYPHAAATQVPAKTSATAIRRRLSEQEDEVFVLPAAEASSRKSPTPPLAPASDELSGARKGELHHLFLQLMRLDTASSEALLRREAERLIGEFRMTPAEAAVLDYAGLAAFWNSELGGRIQAQPVHRIHRELPFTARMTPEELGHGREGLPHDLNGDFVVVQGVADLMVLLPESLWVVDFKTDRFDPPELESRTKAYAGQVNLYASALGRIYKRPSTEAWLHFLSIRKSVRVH